MKENILYFIIIGFIKFLAILPKRVRRGFFFYLSRLVYFVAKKTNRIIKANLDLVFDGKYQKKLSHDEIKKIQKYSYYNMLLWVQTQIENFKVTEDEIRDSVTLEGEEIIKKLQLENKHIIIISAHYGNMEMLNTYFSRYVTPLVQVARESNFKLMDKFIVKSREKSGSKIVFRSGAVKKLVKALLKKEVVSLIIDQKINNKEGVKIDFLGKDANQSTTSAALSRKFEAYVVPIAIFNKDNYNYRIKVYDEIEPIKTDNENDDIKRLSQLHANAISKIIIEDPKQWFWPHKRFKSYHREIYE